MNEHMEIFEGKKNSANTVIVGVTVLSFLVLLFWEMAVTKGEFSGNTVGFLLEHGALYAP